MTKTKKIAYWVISWSLRPASRRIASGPSVNPPLAHPA
jgi:hypothetical protein